jgi:outer membrane protein OmpA-like peptidoglycan-associated protein
MNRRHLLCSCIILGNLTTAMIWADPGGAWKSPAPFRTPSSHWQTPGEIKQPTGKWQVPGDLQVPKEIQLVKEKSRVRLRISADTLFAYDKATLNPKAEEVLKNLGPSLLKFGPKSLMTIEGHTDSKGSDSYNQTLSERRAATVLDWLKSHKFIPGQSITSGLGKRYPIEPNAKPDGSDNPAGRQKNRRVEIVVEESK